MGGLGAIETGLTLCYHFTFVRSACTTSGCLHFMCILIIKVECIKYATLVITKISKGNNLENLDNSSYSTLNTRQSKHTDTITTTNLPTHQTHQT
jgi:hypothetical protein